MPDRDIIDLQSDNDAAVEIDKTMDSLSCTLLHRLFHMIWCKSHVRLENICITCFPTLQQHQLPVSMSKNSICQLEKS